MLSRIDLIERANFVYERFGSDSRKAANRKGDGLMANTAVPGLRLRRLCTLVLGFLLLGGLTEVGMAKDPQPARSRKSAETKKTLPLLNKTGDADKVELINQRIA